MNKNQFNCIVELYKGSAENYFALKVTEGKEERIVDCQGFRPDPRDFLNGKKKYQAMLTKDEDVVRRLEINNRVYVNVL